MTNKHTMQPTRYAELPFEELVRRSNEMAIEFRRRRDTLTKGLSALASITKETRNAEGVKLAIAAGADPFTVEVLKDVSDSTIVDRCASVIAGKRWTESYKIDDATPAADSEDPSSSEAATTTADLNSAGECGQDPVEQEGTAA